jgi:uncharacterized BrkB/YihY/UPF0761 family membrane protein
MPWRQRSHNRVREIMLYLVIGLLLVVGVIALLVVAYQLATG